MSEPGGAVSTGASTPGRGRVALAGWLASAAKAARQAGVYLLLSSGLFYFTYKFYQPTFDGTDYFHYYPTYLRPLNLHVSDAPFVYRQLSALLTNLVYRFAPYYHTQIFFAKPGYDQHVFFAALLTNYLALTGCAVLTAVAAERLAPGAPPSVPLFAGALCYLEFFAQQCGMGPITDGLAWLLMAVAFLGYISRSWPTVIVVLALSVVERETIPIMLGVIAGAHLVMSREQRRFDGLVVALCVAAFGAYWAMRTIWAPVAGHEDQLQVGASVVRSIRHWRQLLSKDLLFQGFLTQNLLILLAITLVWRRIEKRDGAPLALEARQLIIGLFAAAAVLAAIGVLTLGGPNNVGRVIAMLTPATAALLALAMFPNERAAPAIPTSA